VLACQALGLLGRVSLLIYELVGDCTDHDVRLSMSAFLARCLLNIFQHFAKLGE